MVDSFILGAAQFSSTETNFRGQMLRSKAKRSYDKMEMIHFPHPDVSHIYLSCGGPGFQVTVSCWQTTDRAVSLKHVSTSGHRAKTRSPRQQITCLICWTVTFKTSLWRHTAVHDSLLEISVLPEGLRLNPEPSAFEERVCQGVFARLRAPLRTLLIQRTFLLEESILQRLLKSSKNSFIKDF